MSQLAEQMTLPLCDIAGCDVAETPARLRSQSVEDLRLAQGVERALRASGYGLLRTVSVSVYAGVVTLRGQVSSYYLKQIALATVLAVPGTRQIRNGLDVVRTK